ncbi:alpha-ketoglutarate-dependent dioxygenase AlkB (plasmid) [Devosia neptuniae]|uniref:Alpha-ketoglutarate-dependent dioxygenase AlkB n=1 Tax=Devosia neptuniae TaxID=191302 RepID=A0ABY6C7U7_9HYPH|nr:alpha-ketoglutarate-dependent dioxygenase AlkB [Devosia neptuniae]UXN68185.1 alpha-ketoglutarate-dependent dioxygenase AlkB [Devosia neptuniae]
MTLDLFGEPILPSGFTYQTDIIGLAEESELLDRLAGLPFKKFEFHGFQGKRRVVSFGWKYDFSTETMHRVDPMPQFLQHVRDRAAVALGGDPAPFEQLLVTEYGPGAGIGWHKDKATFADIIGVSLGNSCTLRLRKKAGAKWARVSVTLEPRSAYLLTGVVRSEWEHSIPPVSEPRYSLTFRSLAERR